MLNQSKDTRAGKPYQVVEPVKSTIVIAVVDVRSAQVGAVVAVEVGWLTSTRNTCLNNEMSIWILTGEVQLQEKEEEYDQTKESSAYKGVLSGDIEDSGDVGDVQ